MKQKKCHSPIFYSWKKKDAISLQKKEKGKEKENAPSMFI